MDYKKKYVEALGRAKEILESEDSSEESRECCRKMFPDLKRSEDEWIFKTLYSLINDHDWVNGASKKIVLSWLERQKPMYNLEIPAGDVAPAEEDGPFDEDEFLENELSAFLKNYDKEYDDDAVVSDVARHFYEIGKKWGEEDKEALLERAIDCARSWEIDYCDRERLKSLRRRTC